MRWHSKALLSVICLTSGSTWLLSQNDATPAVELWQLALSAVLATVLISVVRFRHDGIIFSSASLSGVLVVSGVGALGAPAVLFLLGRQQLNSLMATATEASIPLLVAIAVSHMAGGAESRLRLGPGLVAFAGVLLLFPVALPGSWHGWSGLLLYLAACCLAATCSVVCHREMIRLPSSNAVLQVALGNALFLLLSAGIWTALFAQPGVAAPSALMSRSAVIIVGAATLAGVIYLLWLVEPIAAASRFVLTPLVATVEAYVLLRPTLSFRGAAGAMLMLIGALACLREMPEDDPLYATSLR